MRMSLDGDIQGTLENFRRTDKKDNWRGCCYPAYTLMCGNAVWLVDDKRHRAHFDLLRHTDYVTSVFPDLIVHYLCFGVLAFRQFLDNDCHNRSSPVGYRTRPWSI